MRAEKSWSQCGVEKDRGSHPWMWGYFSAAQGSSLSLSSQSGLVNATKNWPVLSSVLMSGLVFLQVRELILLTVFKWEWCCRCKWEKRDMGRTLLSWQQWPLLWAQTTLGKFTQSRWNSLPKMIYQSLALASYGPQWVVWLFTMAFK